jgi:hypothetical protein
MKVQVLRRLLKLGLTIDVAKDNDFKDEFFKYHTEESYMNLLSCISTKEYEVFTIPFLISILHKLENTEGVDNKQAITLKNSLRKKRENGKDIGKPYGAISAKRKNLTPRILEMYRQDSVLGISQKLGISRKMVQSVIDEYFFKT